VSQMRRQGYPLNACCAAVGLARSSYYHKPKPKDEGEVKAAIERIALKYPTYGSRRIKAQLARPPYGLQVSRERVQRLLKELNLSVKSPPKRQQTSDGKAQPVYANLLKTLRLERPNQVWVADISYLRLPKRELYFCLLMDAYTRGLRGWHLSRSLGQELTLVALQRALAAHPAPAIHHSDRGSQYTAKSYLKLLAEAGVQVSMSAAGKPSENGYAERLIRSIKEEEVYLNEYQTVAEARRGIADFMEHYQHGRIHSALGYRTPAEFEAQALAYPL